MDELTTSWHSYPSIYALGHRHLADLLLDPVVVQEKVDGSQFSFGRFGDVVRVRSRGQEMVVEAPEKMFSKAVEYVLSIKEQLHDGWTYRGEYLQKPHHNALTYGRVPLNHVILFDVNDGHESYLGPGQVAVEANRLGLEMVPTHGNTLITTLAEVKGFMERESVLGGCKVEGIVIKNYTRFGQDKKALMGKWVSEEFKEKHKGVMYGKPGKGDVLTRLILQLRTEARWQKGVQHLREAGTLEDAPKDIGALVKEVQGDVMKEEREWIMEELWKEYWGEVSRGVTRGLAEWYKEQLAMKQFGPVVGGE